MDFGRKRETERKEGIRILIPDNIENGFPKEVILDRLAKRYGLNREKAEACYELTAHKWD